MTGSKRIMAGLLVAMLAAAAHAAQFDVRDHGAKGDGTANDTAAIQKAIDAASAAGGGTVLFPAGTYSSYSINLKSNVALYLDAGSKLLAAVPTATAGYAADPPNPWGDELRYQDGGHSHWMNSLIWAVEEKNISILGPGMIDGEGLERGDANGDGTGNKILALKLCRNVTLKDITMFRGGHFCILPTGVENFTIHNVKIDTNRDGINIDACKNVRISDSHINTRSDDAIVLKSSFGLGYAKDTENVTITNCTVSGYDVGSFLDGTFTKELRIPDGGGATGRIKFGTESNGGFKNITINNCVFDSCRGLALETVDGGHLEDIAISNITMRNVTGSPIFLRLGARMRGPEGVEVGKLRRISISNVTASNVDTAYPIMIMGIPGHPVEDVVLSNIRIENQGGGTAEHAARAVAELETGYPDPWEFVRPAGRGGGRGGRRGGRRGAAATTATATAEAPAQAPRRGAEPREDAFGGGGSQSPDAASGPLPAYGVYIRHAKGVTLENVQLGFIADDKRPAVALDDVDGADFFRVRADKSPDVPVFKMKGVKDINVRMTDHVADTKIDAADDRSL